MHMRNLLEKGRNKLGDSLSPTRSAGEDTYLSYYDITLKIEDVNSIKYDDWLTDQAISFWQEVLEREDLIYFPKASIVLLRPTMSFMLMQTPDPMTIKEALPNFSTTTHVFLPINDCRDVTKAEGGSHWTLLLVSIIDGVAFHYDSMNAANEREARSTTAKLEQLLGKRLRFIPMHDAPQQENGSDCGVFVCILMKHLLLKRLLRADATKKISMSMRDAHINARDGRRTMLKVIEDKRREGERRRSRSHSPFRPHSAHSRSPPRVGDENAIPSNAHPTTTTTY